ncbi:hypothetical protein D3C77_234610 [compost metagenome]
MQRPAQQWQIEHQAAGKSERGQGNEDKELAQNDALQRRGIFANLDEPGGAVRTPDRTKYDELFPAGLILHHLIFAVYSLLKLLLQSVIFRSG